MSTVVEHQPTAGNPLVEGLERLPVHPTALVIFGATGDLARRKLLPALYNLAHEGALPERFELVGVARKPDEDFAQMVRESIEYPSATASSSNVPTAPVNSAMRWSFSFIAHAPSLWRSGARALSSLVRRHRMERRLRAWFAFFRGLYPR